MAELPGTFDPGAISDDREILPAGEVLAQIFESDLVNTKSGTGQLIKFGWEIISGPLQGRKLWTNVNVQNSNAQAQEIGQRDLKRICEAAGVGPIRNSDQLHFKPMLIAITVSPAKGDYGPSNDIKGYKFYGPPGSAPAPNAPTGGAPQAPTAPAATAAKPAGSVPWPTR
jgi:hypothetical protein